ncbi:50S ribosomal protein L9 [Roseospirillum parvum]|uniref:Large ribosomal subunit protein bL9 n=1 Tax=Roseospirillum parvum TaxID=83401 RepID=A0A1G8B0T0_9PROT|nr:50S ribosomal protein L9 [Roseospirillum parvum]SDH26735.1 large subunit ribosomal protein L9 [Roseospirillum parvum]
MDVILLERVDKLGQMGDTVKVKPGYARNYLLPQKKALRATKANQAHFEGMRAELEARNLERRQEAEQVAERMQGLELVMIRAAGESGQLYGSVAARDVAEALKDAGIKVERRSVNLTHQIKATGAYTVPIVLHPEVSVDVRIGIGRSDEEARAHLEGRSLSAEAREADEALAAEQAAMLVDEEEDGEAEFGAGDYEADDYEADDREV